VTSKFSELSKWEWRTKAGVKQRRVKIELIGKYESYTPEELVERVQDLNLLEAQVELDDVHRPYDEPTVALFATGWRDATKEEIDEALAALDAQKDQQQEWKRRQIEALRQSDPDLFKE
jgi:hypothetical protein